MRCYCKHCRSMQEVICIEDLTSEHFAASCSKCNSQINLTKDDVLKHWRKVVNGDTSIKKGENNDANRQS